MNIKTQFEYEPKHFRNLLYFMGVWMGKSLSGTIFVLNYPTETNILFPQIIQFIIISIELK